jgi:hypothetical protein
MQKNSYPNITNTIPDKNERRISVNYFQPKQSKFLETIYSNAEEYETEKFKTFRHSAMSNSDYYDQFSFESEQKPTQITPFNDSLEQDQPEKLEKLENFTNKNYNFISDSKYYIHCNVCLTIISGESNILYNISVYYF